MKKTTQKITLENDFHNTQINVQVSLRWPQLSQAQMARVQKTLCGMADCTCGGTGTATTPDGEHVSFDIVQDIYGDNKDTIRFFWTGVIA